MTTLSHNEVMDRLDSLDWASPVVDRPRAEKFFLDYLKSLAAHRPYGSRTRSLYKLAENIAIHWLPGTFDFQHRMHDLGFYGGSMPEFFSMHWANINHMYRQPVSNDSPERTSPQLQLFRLVSPPLDGWVRNHAALRNNNLFRAFLAGLGWFIVQKRAVFLFPRPAIRTRHETNTRLVLHSAIGPAVEFPDDPVSNQYWFRGVLVREFVVTNPERITRAHIRAARHAQQRQALIEQYGLLRYSLERGFKPFDINEYCGATLYVKGGKRTHYGGTTQRECVVELVNSTPEPDGTHRHFARRVPGNMQSAHQAVAWTFGFDNPRDYMPIVQT